MALRTLGTNATTSLQAVAFSHAPAGLAPADIAAFNALVKSDMGTSGQLNSYLDYDGVLWIPRRGWLRVFPGDYVGVDAATGWPILLSAAAIAGGPYTHT